MLKNLAANTEAVGDVDSVPGWESSPGGGNGNPLQYSCWANSTDRGAWRAIVHGVTTEQQSTHSCTLGCKYLQGMGRLTLWSRQSWLFQGKGLSLSLGLERPWLWIFTRNRWYVNFLSCSTSITLLCGGKNSFSSWNNRNTVPIYWHLFKNSDKGFQ